MKASLRNTLLVVASFLMIFSMVLSMLFWLYPELSAGVGRTLGITAASLYWVVYAVSVFASEYRPLIRKYLYVLAAVFIPVVIALVILPPLSSDEAVRFFNTLAYLVSFSYLLYFLGYSKQAASTIFIAARLFFVLIEYVIPDGIIDRNILDAIIVSMLFDTLVGGFAVILRNGGYIERFPLLTVVLMERKSQKTS